MTEISKRGPYKAKVETLQCRDAILDLLPRAFHIENSLLAAVADSRRAGARAIYLPLSAETGALRL